MSGLLIGQFLAVAVVMPLAAEDAPGATTRPRRTVRYHEISPYDHVFVIEENGLRFLRLGSTFGDNQSVLDLADPDNPVMEYINLTLAGAALAPKLERALVIGFGAGSVTRCWGRHLPGLWIDNVEIDPLVTAVAFLYFRFKPSERMPIHVMDGREFVRSSTGAYDLVLLDAFGAGDAPYHLTTLEFYNELKAKLAPGAAVVANMIAARDETVAAQARTFAAAFATVYRFAATREQNTILVGTDAPRLPDAELAARFRAFAKAGELGFDPVERWALTPELSRTSEGPILHDTKEPAS